MLFDLHVHTAGMSNCARSPYQEMVDEYVKAGYGGVVLTNHYNFLYTVPYGGAYWASDYPKAYLDEFYRARDYGAKKGLKVFFGREVAISLPKCTYAEFLYYGITPDEFLRYADMFEYDQKGLFEVANKCGAVLVQSHPFRIQQGHIPHDPKFMHGVEINCHAKFLRDEDKVRAFASEHNLLVTCGSDYHINFQAGCAGVDFFENPIDEKDLATKIKNGEYKIFIK